MYLFLLAALLAPLLGLLLELLLLLFDPPAEGRGVQLEGEVAVQEREGQHDGLRLVGGPLGQQSEWKARACEQ